MGKEGLQQLSHWFLNVLSNQPVLLVQPAWLALHIQEPLTSNRQRLLYLVLFSLPQNLIVCNIISSGSNILICSIVYCIVITSPESYDNMIWLAPSRSFVDTFLVYFPNDIFSLFQLNMSLAKFIK